MSRKDDKDETSKQKNRFANKSLGPLCQASPGQSRQPLDPLRFESDSQGDLGMISSRPEKAGRNDQAQKQAGVPSVSEKFELTGDPRSLLARLTLQIPSFQKSG